jgi:hypothetical protein
MALMAALPSFIIVDSKTGIAGKPDDDPRLCGHLARQEVGRIADLEPDLPDVLHKKISYTVRPILHRKSQRMGIS